MQSTVQSTVNNQGTPADKSTDMQRHIGRRLVCTGPTASPVAIVLVDLFETIGYVDIWVEACVYSARSDYKVSGWSKKVKMMRLGDEEVHLWISSLTIL